MKWKLEEFIQQLKLDPSLHVLFVEGDHDLSFWRSVVPMSDRLNTDVYKIGTVDLNVDRGGEKAKIIELANILKDHEVGPRVKFFADADHDRLLERSVPSSVILTDTRDRETYLLSQDGIASLCETGFNRDAQFSAETYGLVRTLLRPVGIVRVMSERNGENLPFQQTCNPESDPGKVRRFWNRNGRITTLNLSQFLSVLLQNAQRSLSDKDRLEAAVAQEQKNLSELDDDQIIHGKDLVAFVGWRFQCTYDAAQACVNLALCQHNARFLDRPNLRAAVGWIRQQGITLH